MHELGTAGTLEAEICRSDSLRRRSQVYREQEVTRRVIERRLATLYVLLSVLSASLKLHFGVGEALGALALRLQVRNA